MKLMGSFFRIDQDNPNTELIDKLSLYALDIVIDLCSVESIKDAWTDEMYSDMEKGVLIWKRPAEIKQAKSKVKETAIKLPKSSQKPNQVGQCQTISINSAKDLIKPTKKKAKSPCPPLLNEIEVLKRENKFYAKWFEEQQQNRRKRKHVFVPPESVEMVVISRKDNINVVKETNIVQNYNYNVTINNVAGPEITINETNNIKRDNIDNLHTDDIVEKEFSEKLDLDTNKTQDGQKLAERREVSKQHKFLENLSTEKQASRENIPDRTSKQKLFQNGTDEVITVNTKPKKDSQPIEDFKPIDNQITATSCKKATSLEIEPLMVPAKSQDNSTGSKNRASEEIFEIRQDIENPKKANKADSFHQFESDWSGIFNETKIISEPKSSPHKCLNFFRYLNLTRALITTSYGFYVSFGTAQSQALAFPYARAFQISTLFFLCLDLFLTCCKVLPDNTLKSKLAVFINPKTFSIWQLVADPDLIMDALPLIANCVLKVYAFRMGEILATSSVPLGGISPDQLEQIAKTREFNLALLVLFCVSVVFTVSLHTLKIVRSLLARSAVTLGLIVVVKSAMLLFDLTVNAFLLYSTLVLKGRNLFDIDVITNLVLAIVVPSIVVTLQTNVIVNFPLHYTFLRMLIKEKVPLNVQKYAGTWNLVLFALRKTFHPRIFMTVGIYSVFSMVSLWYVLLKTRSVDLDELVAVGVNLAESNLLYVLLWFNLIINYLVGIASLALFILYTIFSIFRK